MSTNLILGGTHGLGAEIAAALRQEGEETYVVGRSYDAARDGAGEKLDLNDRKAVEAFALKVQDMPLKSFYWVAGYIYSGDFAAQDDVLEMADVNFANPLPIAHAAWQKLLAVPTSTRFVIVSSTSGIRARDLQVTYAATKHAQVGLGRSLGQESERLKSKVKVALFLPGGMKTPLWDGQKPEAYDSFLDPAKVAQRIVSESRYQGKPFIEELIERGSL